MTLLLGSLGMDQKQAQRTLRFVDDELTPIQHEKLHEQILLPDRVRNTLVRENAGRLSVSFLTPPFHSRAM